MILEARSIEKFRALVGKRLGLQFGDDKLDFLEDVLLCRVAEGGHASAGDYLWTLSDPGPHREELGCLAEALTVTETYFFRNDEQFRALVEAAIPLRMKARSASRSLRILSAGCASGEEAYTIAMVLSHECPALDGWEIKITGADLNPAMLDAAKKGLYSSWPLRATTPEMREKFFQAEGMGFRVREEIRASVTYEARNFSEGNADLWEAGAYDVIFCRNMMMYFNAETAAAHLDRMSKALAPEAFLFLGSAETLRGISLDFDVRHTHGTFYYQRLPGSGPAQPQRASSAAPAAITAPKETAPSPWGPETACLEPKQRAPERIAGISVRVAGRGAAPASRSLDQTMDLLKSERFADALESLGPIHSDKETLLLVAVLLTHLGRLDDAEAACRRLLGIDGLNAGAHYILALCREQAGDLNGAEQQDRMAVTLDTNFAMPWLHLGLLARHQKKAELAGRHLRQALVLLNTEDSSRLLLFGGGFGREGLAQLCRNGVESLGAAS